MTYRIRYYLALSAILPLMALSWNAGHNTGLRDMMDSFDRQHGEAIVQIKDTRRMLCQLPVGGAVCVQRLPVRKPG